jgi:leucyl-tRNA synthetase
MKRYFPNEIEPKWREIWEKDGLYKFDQSAKAQKYYNLVELPYPSGDLHLGHWFAFTPPDAHARYKRMSGFNVFFPNGFDAFGLPAENAAIKRGVHPKDWTMKNIETMKKQFATIGTMIDWSHEVITCLPEYYRWNQWIFLKMFEKGVAYRGKALSNWCPVDQTVLANEHIEAGKCWRCGSEVVQKEVEQWFLRITDYADQLIWQDPPQADWPKMVREGQNNWIGKSDGLIFTSTVK